MDKLLYWTRAVLSSAFLGVFAYVLCISIDAHIQDPPAMWELAMATIIALLVGLAHYRPSRSNHADR